MRNLIPHRPGNSPRCPVARLLDRLTPPPLRVYYGPDETATWGGEGCRYSWICGRCARRGSHAQYEGFTRSLEHAHLEAKVHARKHFGMRVAYLPED